MRRYEVSKSVKLINEYKLKAVKVIDSLNFPPKDVKPGIFYISDINGKYMGRFLHEGTVVKCEYVSEIL